MFFDKDLLERSKRFDEILKPLGDYAPKKRLLHMDYKENGIDKNIDLSVYQSPGMDDEKMLSEVMKAFTAQGQVVGCIGEVDSDGFPISILYVAPWYQKECMEELEVIRWQNAL